MRCCERGRQGYRAAGARIPLRESAPSLRAPARVSATDRRAARTATTKKSRAWSGIECSPDGAAITDNCGWSLYGAPWLQPDASSGKSGAPKPARSAETVAVGCDGLQEGAHGKEGVDDIRSPAAWTGPCAFGAGEFTGELRLTAWKLPLIPS